MKVNIPIYDLDKICQKFGTTRNHLAVVLGVKPSFFQVRKLFTIKKKGYKSFSEEGWNKIVETLKAIRRSK